LFDTYINGPGLS